MCRPLSLAGPPFKVEFQTDLARAAGKMLGCHSASTLTGEDHIGVFSSFWLVVNSNPQIFFPGMAAKATSCAFDLWLGLAEAYA